MCIGIGNYSSVKCVEYQWIVIAVTDDESYDSAVIKVENGTEVNFVLFNSFIPFELGNICKPFLIRLFCMKFTVKNIFCNVLRIVRLPCTTVVSVLDGGFNPFNPADTEDSLVTYVDVMKSLKVIADTPISFVWAPNMNLFGYFCYVLILALANG